MSRDADVLGDGARRHLPNEDDQARLGMRARRNGRGREKGASRTTRRLGQRDEARVHVRLHEEFLSVAAHELRTPVATLVGFAQLLERRLERETLSVEQVRAAARQIRECGAKITVLINQLLDIGRIRRASWS